jgi:hypothetical protein
MFLNEENGAIIKLTTMLNDLIKIFAEEPEKIEKAVLRGVKILLNVLIAAWLYKLIIGPFYLFPLNSYGEWESFLLSGRILICLLFYFICEYLIFQLFTLPGYLLSLLVIKIDGPNKQEDIQTLLKIFGILKYDKEKDLPMPGKNIDILLEVSKAFQNEETKSEIEAVRSTFISNVLDIYSSFVTIYFIILPTSIHTVGLTTLVIVILVLLLVFYAVIHGMIEYMSKHYENILQSLFFIKINGLLYSVLASYGIYPSKPSKNEGINKCRVFYRGAKEYILCRPITNKQMLIHGDAEIERLIQKKQQPERMFIVVAGEGILNDSRNIRTKYSHELLLIEYKNENDLRLQLNNHLAAI